MCVDALRPNEFPVVHPGVTALGKPSLIVAEWLAMSRGRVLLVRGAVADVTVQHNESGTLFGFPEDVDGVLDALDVVGVADAQDVPTVIQKPACNVLSESDARIALDGDVVVVVDPAEIIEAQVTSQGRGFRRDAFHHAAITANRINIVVENFKTGAVVTIGEPLFRDTHSHARGDALPQWAGRGLNA